MALPQEKSYTYADLLEWNDGKRYELYNGQPVMMSPPLRQHQEISGEIYLQIGTYLKGKKCKVYHAPFSVRPSTPWRASRFSVNWAVPSRIR